jgi:hypothetical protein
MPDTRTYHISEELERIDSELDDLADEAAALDDDEALSSTQQQRIQQLERQYAGLKWATSEGWESVTLSELTAGSYMRAGAQAEQDARESNAATGTDTERLYRIAQAIDGADFLGDNPTHKQTLAAVGQLKPHFFFWLEQRVDDLTAPAVEGNSFAERVAAKTSSDCTSSTSDE